MIAYRRDIDGLRGLAVLAVVLFHYGVPGFSGGYVGVDVFFVISGYLITALIADDSGFSFARFYERRVRRIFPALLVMLAAVTAASLVLLLPLDLEQYGKSLLATALMAANIHFWRGAGYFEIAADLKPLLHVWSLAVEEQFYLGYPLLLWLLRPGGRRFTAAALGIVTVASLVASEWAAQAHPDAAFFLTPFRVWELSFGALLALWAGPRPGPRLSHGLGMAGLALIAAAVAFYSKQTPFPGAAAVVPCLGAGLVIVAGADGRSAASRLLARPWLVGVGLISYSLYLWHWPFLVLGGYYAPDGLGWAQKTALVAASFAVAALSWRFVEQPVRRGAMSRARLFLVSGGAAAAMAAAGLSMVALDGLPGRFSPQVQAIVADERPVMLCPGEAASHARPVQRCRIGPESAPPSFLVWGDSHALALAPAFEAAATSSGRGGLIVASAGCPPLMGVSRKDVPGCPAFNSAQLALALDPGVRDVFLVGRWGLYAEGERYGREAGGRVVLKGAGRGNPEVFAAGLEETVRRLRAAGKRVVIVHSVPEAQTPVPEAMAKARLTGAGFDIAPSTAGYLRRQAFTMATAKRLEARYGVASLYPHETLCPHGTCLVESGGRPLYRDNHHLNPLGAARLAGVLTAALDAKAP